MFLFIISEESGRSQLNVKLPAGSKFKQMIKTQSRTKFEVEIVSPNGNKTIILRMNRLSSLLSLASHFLKRF